MPGLAGRKALPTYLKVLKGTDRPSRENKEAPEPSKEKPRPPSWLSKRAKQIFNLQVKRQSTLGIASSSYTDPLALLSTRLEEVELMSKDIEENGRTYCTESGLIKARPEVAMRNEALRHAQSLLAECCLTHTSSQRISAPGTKKKTSEWE